MFSTRTFLPAVLALSLSLLAACGSAPQATDPVDDLAALADANGDLEATLNIVSVVASGAPSTAHVLGNDVSYQLTYEKITWTYRGKTGNGFSLSSSTPGSQVAAALAAGDQMRIRGRVRKLGNVPAFVGVMRSQASGASAVAVTPPTPVVLVGAGKAIAGPSGIVTLTDVLVSSYFYTLPEKGDQVLGLVRSSDGKTEATVRITSPRDTASGLPTGRAVQARLSGRIEWLQTQLGPVGKLTGVLTYGPSQTVEVQGVAAATEVAAKD